VSEERHTYLTIRKNIVGDADSLVSSIKTVIRSSAHSTAPVIHGLTGPGLKVVSASAADGEAFRVRLGCCTRIFSIWIGQRLIVGLTERSPTGQPLGAPL
jgi:hypothetical protein